MGVRVGAEGLRLRAGKEVHAKYRFDRPEYTPQ